MYEHATIDRTLGKNIPLLLRSRVKLIPESVLQASKNEAGEFIYYSYKDVYTHVIEVACALKKFGLRRGDHVGLISDNRREWLVTDLALLSLGAADVPRGCDSMGTEIRFILNYADCSVSFFETGHQLGKVLEKRSEVPGLKAAILFDPPDKDIQRKAEEEGIDVFLFSDFEQSGIDATGNERHDIEAEMDRTDPGEIATIIFTSGTTGTPKGVMLTHDSIMALMEVVHDVLPAERGDMWLSILPVWHSFERAVQYYIITTKSGIAYSKPVAQVMLADMAVIHPQWICGVPRLWEGFARGIYKAMKKTGGLIYMLFMVSMAAGTAYYWAKEGVFGLRCRYRRIPRIFGVLLGFLPFILLVPFHALFYVLVYSRIRERFGGRLRAGISGGGSLPPEIDNFYHAVGIMLLEGYGVTETAPVLSVRSYYKPRSGCVGEVYPSCQVKIVAEENGKIVSQQPLPPGKMGILMARGRQVMKGYYKRPDLTAQVIDKDGWFNTGDMAMLSCDNEIKIFGRVKDTIVLIDGENIEPLLVEQAITGSVYIDNAVVVGQDQRYLGALIVPNRENLELWAREKHISFSLYEDLLAAVEVKRFIQAEIDARVNARTGFRPCERVFKSVLLPESFQQGREINGKLEVMRYKIPKLYESEIASLFE